MGIPKKKRYHFSYATTRGFGHAEYAMPREHAHQVTWADLLVVKAQIEADNGGGGVVILSWQEMGQEP